MNWKVKIEGDKQYLDCLNCITVALDFDTKILKEGEEYFIEGSIFENTKDAKEVAEKAKSFLIFLQATQFKTERVAEPLKIKEISDSENRHFYDSNGNLTCEILEDGRMIVDDMTHYNIFVGKVEFLNEAEDGTITGGLFTIESIVNYIDKNDVKTILKARSYLQPKFESFIRFINSSYNDKTIKEISDLLSLVNEIKNFRVKAKNRPEVQECFELAEWTVLYRIYEMIEKDIEIREEGSGGKILKNKNWVSKEQIESFTSTINYFYRHSKFRLSGGRFRKRKMKLTEAEDMILTLISRYIEEKSKF